MRKVILGLVAITALVSCKKEDNGNDTTIQEGTFPKEVTYKDKDGKIIGKSITTIDIIGKTKCTKSQNEKYIF